MIFGKSNLNRPPNSISRNLSKEERIGYIDYRGYEYLWRCQRYSQSKGQSIEEIILKARTFNQVFYRLKNRFYILKDETWIVRKVKKVTPMNYYSKPSVYELKKRSEKNTNNK